MSRLEQALVSIVRFLEERGVPYMVIGREKDRLDVQGVIRQQRERLDREYLDPRVKSLTQALARPDVQAWYDQCLRETGVKK